MVSLFNFDTFSSSSSHIRSFMSQLLFVIVGVFLLSSPLITGELFDSDSLSPDSDDVDRVDVLISFTLPGPLIPTNFVSFSTETYSLFDWTGHHPQPIKENFLRLLLPLTPTLGSPGPTIRIGGNSADMSSYNPNHTPRPHLPYGRPLWYDITDQDLLTFHSVAEAINGKLVFGLNFRVPDDASLAIRLVKAIDRLIGWRRIYALEIGNEVDVYEWTKLRPANYSMKDYIKEFDVYARAIHRALPHLPQPIFQGGVWGTLNWHTLYSHFMSAERNYIKSISYHHYPLSLCEGTTPTIPRLLSDSSSQNKARTLIKSQFVSYAREYELPLVVGEGSAVSCGRMPGISNSFASSLWSIDQMFIDASIGVQSWHFHYAGGNSTGGYSPLVKENSNSDVLTVMPVYYGMRFFAQATLNYSTIYRVNVSSTTNKHIKIYSVLTQSGNVLISILHKDSTSTINAVINLSFLLPSSFSAYPIASISRLEADSASASSGVTMGGQWYDGSDGRTKGVKSKEWVKPLNGVYSLTVKPVSAVLIALMSDGPFDENDSAITSLPINDSSEVIEDSSSPASTSPAPQKSKRMNRAMELYQNAMTQRVDSMLRGQKKTKLEGKVTPSV